MHARARFPIIQLLLVVLLLAVAAVVNVSFAKAQDTFTLGTAGSQTLLAGTTITNGAGTTFSGSNGVRVAISPGALIESNVSSLRTSFAATVVENQNTASALAQTDFDIARRQLKGYGTSVLLDKAAVIFKPGTYYAGDAWSIATDITLDGDNNPNSVFIFKITGAITTAASTKVILINGAEAKNIYWVTEAAFDTGASSQFAGRVFAIGAATIGASSVINGQLLVGPAAAITLGASVNIISTADDHPFGYSVSFASGSASGGQEAISGSATHLLFPQNTFTRAGYVFAGWNTAADGTGERFTAGGSYKLTGISNLIIYPTWLAVAQPTPTAEPSASTAPSATPESSASPTPSAAPTPSVSPSTPTTPSFAYSVTFASAAGSGSQSSISGVETHFVFPENTLTNEGYVFFGWNTSSNGLGTRYIAGASYSLSAITNLTLYPIWVAVERATETTYPTESTQAPALPTPSTSANPTPSVSPTSTPSVSPTSTPTASPTPTRSASPTSTPTASPTTEPAVIATPADEVSLNQPELLTEPVVQTVSNPGISQPRSLELANTLSKFSAETFEPAPEYQAIGAVLQMVAAVVAVPIRFVSDTVSLASDGVAALISGWDPKYISTVLNVGISG
jgi:hypothetical protein